MSQLAPWLQRQLAGLSAQRGHALLLTGAPGLGQYDLALALAARWLCEAPEQGHAGQACGQCPSCHAIAVRTHADLMVLLPEALALETGWPLDPRTQDKIDRKEAKPSRQIRVDAAREAVAFTQMTRARGATKVVLVYPAESLNHEAANTLLKTLEEPPGAVRFVLASEAAHDLLPTLRSRCQTQQLPWPAEAEALAWLQATEANTDPTAWPTWLRAAGGRPDEARALAALGLDAKAWNRLPQDLARGDASAIAGWPPPQQLQTLQKLCHDLMALAAGAGPRFFAPEALPRGMALPSLARWQKQLAQAARHVDHPFNAGLMLEAWAAAARAALGDTLAA